MAAQKNRKEQTEPIEPRPDERLLWAQFRRASTNKAFFRSWLAVQCAAMEEVRFGLILWRGSTPGSQVVILLV